MSRYTAEARPRGSRRKWKRYARHIRTEKYQPYGSPYYLLRRKKFSGTYSEAQADAFTKWAHSKGLEVRMTRTRSTQRDLMVEWMTWAVNHEPDIHYSQDINQRMNLARMKNKRLPLAEDCSSSTIGMHYYAGAPDPAGNGYNKNATNYTGTLLTGSKVIGRAQLKPGSMIIYGPGSGDHVCVVYKLSRDGNHLLFSHGQERGPIIISMSAEAQFQSGPIRYRDAVG